MYHPRLKGKHYEIGQKMGFIFKKYNAKFPICFVAVNHFTSEEMWKHDASNRDVFFSEARYQTAYNALKDADCLDGVEHAKAILSGRHGFMCQYKKPLNFDTIWSSVFDISNKKIHRAEGNPSRTRFKEDTRLFKASGR